MFYVDPQPLNAERFGTWRMKGGNAAFTAKAMGVPVVLGEFADASRFYPILFAAGEGNGPIVLTGLSDHNLVVKDGFWEDKVYVPGYVRRYPFVLGGVEGDPDRLILAIDAASDFFVKEGTEGVALFENNEPSQFTKDAMTFCETWQRETMNVAEYVKALREKGLLVSQRVDGTTPTGRKFSIDGFEIIDQKKLTDLDAETVVAWHRRGWLNASYLHLISLNRMNEIVARATDPAPSPAPSGTPPAANS
jgi:hypothetical protein